MDLHDIKLAAFMEKWHSEYIMIFTTNNTILSLSQMSHNVYLIMYAKEFVS